jgi:hypothetical protein
MTSFISLNALAWASGGDILMLDGGQPRVISAQRAGELATYYAAKVAEPDLAAEVYVYLTRWMDELEAAITAASRWDRSSLAIAA